MKSQTISTEPPGALPENFKQWPVSLQKELAVGIDSEFSRAYIKTKKNFFSFNLILKGLHLWCVCNEGFGNNHITVRRRKLLSHVWFFFDTVRTPGV